MRIAPLLALLACAAAHAAPMLELKNDDLRFTVNGGGNMRLEVRGVPVFREQSLFIIKPGWTGVYLYQDDATPKCETVSATEGTAAFETDKAYARYRFELLPNAFTMRLTYAATTEPPIEAQVHTYLNANLFAGAVYTSDKGSGKVPPAAMDMNRNRILEEIQQATFQTVLGPVELAIEGNTGAMSLDDYRAGAAEWARKNPMMWLGANVKEMAKGEEKTLTLTLRFDPPAAKPAPKPLVPKAVVAPLAQARIPWVPNTPVIPRPKQPKAFPTERGFRLPANVNIVISDQAGPEERQAAAEIQADLKEIWSVPSRIDERDLSKWSNEVPSGCHLVLARFDQLTGVTEVQDDPMVKSLMAHPEGYFVGNDAVSAGVLGVDGRGVYNGAQTLKQLFRADAKGVYVKPSAIVDWPTVSMRGVHWFGGRNSLPFHTKMIDRIVAPFKMNTMLYEIDFADFDCLKTHDATRGMSKADIKATVDNARKHFLEPIPEIESFGNSDWLFANNQNKDIQWAGRERSYDPHNEKSFTTLFAAYQEAIDLFQPKYFHIGHDEMTVGDKAIPPPGETMSAVDLITESVTRLNNWLKAKDLTTMMWGDTLLHFPEDCADAGTAKSWDDAKAQRKALPKDVVIADWHYDGDSTAYPNVKILQDLGYKVVGCTWFDRNNIRNFAAALARDNALGMIQTTWAGWVMDENIVKGTNGYQFTAYVLAAEHEWNGGKHTLDELGWEPEEVFARAWERKPVDRRVRKGFYVALSPAKEPVKPVYQAGVAFAPGAPVTLSGGLQTAAAPERVSIPLGGAKASVLHFLWKTTVPTDAGTQVATLAVRYSDGETTAVPVEYGRAIFAASDLRAGAETTVVRRWTEKGRPLSMRRWAWPNPRPEAPIASITLTSANTEAAPILMGLSGEE